MLVFIFMCEFVSVEFVTQMSSHKTRQWFVMTTRTDATRASVDKRGELKTRLPSLPSRKVEKIVGNFIRNCSRHVVKKVSTICGVKM